MLSLLLISSSHTQPQPVATATNQHHPSPTTRRQPPPIVCNRQPTAPQVILIITSLFIIWGEFTIPIKKPDMSPFSLMIHGVNDHNEFGVQILTLLPLVYICACIYFTLFRITAFNYNKLIPRATTGAALMQNGSLMCRFAAPTCWNFYHIIRMTNEAGRWNIRDILGEQQL